MYSIVELFYDHLLLNMCTFLSRIWKYFLKTKFVKKLTNLYRFHNTNVKKEVSKLIHNNDILKKIFTFFPVQKTILRINYIIHRKKQKMADQQFFLKWNDFQTNMVTSFRHLRDEKSFTDVSKNFQYPR